METKPASKTTDALFLGAEHVGLYPHKASADEIAAWYEKTFGFQCDELDVSYFLSGSGMGRIEVMKQPAEPRCHIAIRVSDFEQAIAVLKGKGIQFQEPTITPKKKTVFLQETDPDGNPVHLTWFTD